jgi:hypothetical protein
MKTYDDEVLEPQSRFTSSYDAERHTVYDDADPFGHEEGHQVCSAFALTGISLKLNRC